MKLSTSPYLLLLCILLFSCKQQNKTVSHDQLKEEAKTFMTYYEGLLKKSKFDSVATLYHSNGGILTTSGKSELKSFSSIQADYTSNPSDSILYFQWAPDLLTDIVNDSVVVVANSFHAKTNTFPDTLGMIYSAVLVKTNAGWKIKHENESPDIETYKKIMKYQEANK